MLKENTLINLVGGAIGAFAGAENDCQCRGVGTASPRFLSA